MGADCVPRCVSPHSSLDPHRREYSGRFSVKKRHRSMDVHVEEGHVQVHHGSFQPLPDLGCFRLPLVGPAPKIHVLAQGSSGSGPGCFAFSLGPSDFSVPSCASPAKGGQENQGPEDQGYSGMPEVAHSVVVGPVGGHDGGASYGAPLLQNSPPDSRQLTSRALPGPLGSSARFRQEFSLSKSSHDLDADDLEFLSKHLAPETASGYGYAFQKFRSFCEQKQADPLSCSPAIVVKYLRHLSESGAEYSTVNYHRSAISKFHLPVDGVSIGEHPLCSQAVRAVYRLRPPLPKYQATFDIIPVLEYVRSLPTATISLQLLSFKTLFLTIYSSISRVSSIARLGPTLVEHRDSVVLHLFTLEKQARVGNIRGFLQIPNFEDPELCPVRTISTYFNKVSLNYCEFIIFNLFTFRCLTFEVTRSLSLCLT